MYYRNIVLLMILSLNTAKWIQWSSIIQQDTTNSVYIWPNYFTTKKREREREREREIFCKWDNIFNPSSGIFHMSENHSITLASYLLQYTSRKLTINPNIYLVKHVLIFLFTLCIIICFVWCLYSWAVQLCGTGLN